MNKFKFYFIVLITTLSLFSCSKNDTTAEITPLRDYKVQYDTDNVDIETYLKTNYITVTDAPGSTTDQDVIFTKIPEGGVQPSIMSYLNSATFPKLLTRNVNFHGVEYTVYYLVLRPGIGQSPSNADAVLASYNGRYLKSTTTADVTSVTATSFEEVKIDPKYLSLLNTIKGWGEIFPQFKTGSYTSNDDNTITYTGFGAGVMFIPSGLAYYNYGTGSMPSYAPLVFSFKLYEIQRLDTDGDGILNYQEDLDSDGYMYDYRNLVNYPTTPATNPDDTDGDGIPNFMDLDDDGDNATTKLEISKGTDYLDKNSHP